MRTAVLAALVVPLHACAQAPQRPDETTRAQVTFHVAGLEKTPSGAT